MTEKRFVYMDLLETEAISVSDDECYYFNEYGTVKKICDLLNKQDERIRELETELEDMTQRFEYELEMKLKYHSKLIDCEKK